MNALGRLFEPLAWAALVMAAIIAAMWIAVVAYVLWWRIKRAKREGRNWFQLSLLSMVLLSISMGGVAAANLVPYEDFAANSTSMRSLSRGFPQSYTDIGGHVIGLFLMIDIITGVGICLATLFATEWWIRKRHRDTHGPDGQGAA